MCTVDKKSKKAVSVSYNAHKSFTFKGGEVKNTENPS